jgi:hypothetical protein
LNWHSFRHRDYLKPEKVLTFLISQNHVPPPLATTDPAMAPPPQHTQPSSVGCSHR